MLRKPLADNILVSFIIVFTEKTLSISYELSARQVIHMNCQVLLSLNIKGIHQASFTLKKKTYTKKSAALMISTGRLTFNFYFSVGNNQHKKNEYRIYPKNSDNERDKTRKKTCNEQPQCYTKNS